MITLIEEIADYIIPKDNENVRERLGDIMGGKILQLESERLLEKGQLLGEAKGRKTERIEAIQNMIKYDVSKEKILQDYSEEEYNEAVKSMLVEAKRTDATHLILVNGIVLLRTCIISFYDMTVKLHFARYL